MNANPRMELYKQARRQAIWAGIWMGVAVVAMVLRPQATGVHQWLTEQAMFIAGMLMLFQFGRMFQGLRHVRTTKPQVTQPAWSSMEDGARDLKRQPIVHFQARDIRAFASVEEARAHGWEFGESIANFGGLPVPCTARFQGQTYTYDGLSPERLLGAVPSNQRVFGRLSYKLSPPVPLDAQPPLPQLSS